jgi:hypothetical protein
MNRSKRENWQKSQSHTRISHTLCIAKWSLRNPAGQNGKLIHRNTGTGNQPNGYQVLISGSSPSGNSKQVTSEATTIPLLVKDSLANGITRLGKSPLLAVKTVSPSVKGPSQSAAPPRRKASLVELIAICYRQIDSRELAELRSRFPDEASLVAKLESLSCRGDGVAPEMSLGFLAACLEKLG